MSEMKVKCKECGAEFTITEGEQSWYAERGWELPKKCKDCRAKAKAARRAHNK